MGNSLVPNRLNLFSALWKTYEALKGGLKWERADQKAVFLGACLCRHFYRSCRFVANIYCSSYFYVNFFFWTEPRPKFHIHFTSIRYQICFIYLMQESLASVDTTSILQASTRKPAVFANMRYGRTMLILRSRIRLSRTAIRIRAETPIYLWPRLVHNRRMPLAKILTQFTCLDTTHVRAVLVSVNQRTSLSFNSGTPMSKRW